MRKDNRIANGNQGQFRYINQIFGGGMSHRFSAVLSYHSKLLDQTAGRTNNSIERIHLKTAAAFEPGGLDGLVAYPRGSWVTNEDRGPENVEARLGRQDHSHSVQTIL